MKFNEKKVNIKFEGISSGAVNSENLFCEFSAQLFYCNVF